MITDKLNKFLVIIFLALLIWAWAYMAIEKPLSRPGSLIVSSSIDPGTLVLFSLNNAASYQKEIPLTSLNFKGAPSQISDLLKRYNLPPGHEDKERLDFYYDPGERTESSFTLDVLDYLQKSSKVQDLALTLESCMPPQIDVRIEMLEEKKLPIQCLDGNGTLRKEAQITPAFANIYVRKGYEGPATVSLTQQQIENARRQPVKVVPYVRLGIADVVRESAEPVEVVLQSETLLKPRTFKTTKPVGIFMSERLQNAYKVTLLNDEKIRETMLIYATDEAFRAYENMAYPLYIVIRDNDVVDLSKIPPKTIYYNFPREYVRSGEIAEDETKLPRTAEIKVEAVNPVLTP